MKVYCNNCRRHRLTHGHHDIPIHSCVGWEVSNNSSDPIYNKSNYKSVRRSCKELNCNNDCKYYKPRFFLNICILFNLILLFKGLYIIELLVLNVFIWIGFSIYEGNTESLPWDGE